MSWLFRNWHLKLGAIALAMVLYTGLVYSEAFQDRTFEGLGVTALNQQPKTYLLTQQLGTVDVQYRQAAGSQRPGAVSFAATIDLADYDMAKPGELQALPVTVTSLQSGIEVRGWDPRTVPVQIDTIDTRDGIPVVVDRGTIPAGLQIGTPVVSSTTVSATGPHSQVVRVARAVARVVIQASGLDVQAQVDLQAQGVDGQGINLVQLTPSAVTVSIDVSARQATKTVPIQPNVTGTPAAGYEIGAVTVSPNVVTIRGAPDILADITSVSTQVVSVSGARQPVQATPELSLPAGTTLAEGENSTPSVSVQVTSPIVSRTFLLGLICQGAPAGTSCLPQLAQVAVTLRGAAAILAGLDASTLTPILDVSGFAPGTYDVPVEVPPRPPGVDLISISPVTARVEIVVPATPTPVPSPTP